ncbi:DUF3300 domain-containing protein [Tropicimonas sediminicola]|uniref:LysM domain-containing protein n=1 Tax=Tropicimonas sediminicola TaxID=1031541 RepID=A0A239LLN2_9RHOB|nr:DUF3300 domain-containing protein [Tropicimonas sediminicola]SNT31486.1 Protein of unknown function [Tropicimonas sediminicola]
MLLKRFHRPSTGPLPRFILIPGLAALSAIGLAPAPVAAQMLVGDGTVTCGADHLVESGDTLSRLAERAYGDPQLYGFIADANWDALGGNIENIAVGMSLAIPCVDTSGEVLSVAQRAEIAESLEEVIAVEGVLTPDELDILFGPVALFPDPVLTPVLVAVTFPLDVVKAGRFVEETEALPDGERASQAADQPWDSSVRELAAGFPDLVNRMNENLDWTEQSGEAVVAQTDGVLDAIQRLRQKAIDNGYLVDNDAQVVEQQGDTIVINPVSPGVVYVPVYDSQVVYTTQVVDYPHYHYGPVYDDDDWDEVIIGGGILLGAAIILDEIFDDDDWDGWGDRDEIDWDRGDITIDRGDIDIDRGDINIGGDGITIGDGDRPQIGDGDRPQIGDGGRVSIGDSDRPQVDRGDLETVREGLSNGDRPAAGTLPANRASISSTASREAARKKIEARKSTGVQPAQLTASRPTTSRPSLAPAQQRVPNRATTSRPTTSRAATVSRPSAQRMPTARAPSRSNTFSRPSGGGRAAAASSRGRASMGARGGGGRGGGGRR